MGAKMGGQTVLTDEEESRIVKYIMYMAKIMYPLSRSELSMEIKKVLDRADRKTKFTDNIPGNQ